MVTDTIVKQTALKFRDYSTRTYSAKFDAEYSGATSGTISFQDGTSFEWNGISALDNKYSVTNTLYKNLITSATDYEEMLALYQMSISDMEANGTYFNDTFQDSNFQTTRRPLTADMAFIDWLEKKIESKKMLSDNFTTVAVIQYV